MNPFQVLLVGHSDREEFRPIRLSLTPPAFVKEVPDLRTAFGLLQKGEFLPDLVLLLQSYPSEFSQTQVDWVRRLVPLTQIGVVLGPWCEGETRSGKPLPGTWRIYWHQWSARGSRQIERFLQGECPIWGLPPTSMEEERVLALLEPPRKKYHGRIGVCAVRRDSAEWICTGLAAWGYETYWIPRGVAPEMPPFSQGESQECRGPILWSVSSGSAGASEGGQRQEPSFPSETFLSGLKAVVFDATDATGEEALWLQEIAARWEKPRVALLVDFPRTDLAERVRPWGVKLILGKPFGLGDLVGQLEPLENDET